jgi:hypothetical protein
MHPIRMLRRLAMAINTISVPIVGKNVTVIVKWIADLEGSSGPHKWNEIHPVTRVVNAK